VSVLNHLTSLDYELTLEILSTRRRLLPSPTKGTLTLSTELVDESGYEPSFWIAVAMGWIECQGERDGWTEGRGGD